MEKFRTLTAIAAPLLRLNIDTDAIIPSREMKTVSKTGLAGGLFAGWRYVEPGSRQENPEFVLNREPFRHAQVLLAGANFGCGSSREHAVWALHEWGIRAVLAPSFGAIFQGNCVRNGIVPAVLDESVIVALAREIEADRANGRITVDLENKRITGPDGAHYAFELLPADREMLLEGLDPIGVTMKRDDEILAYQARDRLRRPWIYLDPGTLDPH